MTDVAGYGKRTGREAEDHALNELMNAVEHGMGPFDVFPHVDRFVDKGKPAGLITTYDGQFVVQVRRLH